MQRLLQNLTGNVRKKVNLHDDEELSALHYASRYNHLKIVQLLVEAGASMYKVTFLLEFGQMLVVLVIDKL